jgi:hypothetical protein
MVQVELTTDPSSNRRPSDDRGRHTVSLRAALDRTEREAREYPGERARLLGHWVAHGLAASVGALSGRHFQIRPRLSRDFQIHCLVRASARPVRADWAGEEARERVDGRVRARSHSITPSPPRLSDPALVLRLIESFRVAIAPDTPARIGGSLVVHSS